MHTLPLDPAELAELIECLSAYTLDLAQVNIDDEDRPKLARLEAINARAQGLQRGDAQALDTPAPAEEAQRLAAIGRRIVCEFTLPAVRYGHDKGRYRTYTFGSKTAQGLGAIVSRIVSTGGNP